jgi:hypothetical protein
MTPRTAFGVVGEVLDYRAKTSLSTYGRLGQARDRIALARILSTTPKGTQMSNKWKPSSPWLRRKAKQDFHGYPVATIAFYGPTADLATKVVVSIVRNEGQDPDPLERWFSEGTDVRNDSAIGEKILAFLKENGAKSVIATDGLIGCPHEEGIDYPEGKSCPQCPYWAGRDRFTRERIH